jgi:hypothetical protein
VLAWAALARRALLASRAARLLCVAAAPLVPYAFVLNPIWGPYDWDLFALLAFLLALLAGHVLAAQAALSSRYEPGVSLVTATHLFVTIPLLWIGLGAPIAAGPFAPDAFDAGVGAEMRAAPR